MKEYLKSKKVTSGIINLGGNVLTIGSKSDGSDYTVGIQKPFDRSGTSIATIKIDDRSVVTSGIYERYYRVDGKIYHHILDTQTGYPVENDLYSVTIISDSSCDGDALSTTCFALGKDKAEEFIKSMDGVEAIFVDNKMNVPQVIGLQQADDPVRVTNGGNLWSGNYKGLVSTCNGVFEPLLDLSLIHISEPTRRS